VATVWIPADRFMALLDQCGVTNQTLGDSGVRRVQELRSGRQEALSLEAADRILTDLDMADWFHLPKEMGGLADLYFEEERYEPSWVPAAKARLASFRGGPGRKTNRCACGTAIQPKSKQCIRCYRTTARSPLTPEQREAKKKRHYHEWSRRQGRRCECGTPITNTSKMCKPCYLARGVKAAHGTRSRYTQGCHCIPCTRAEADYARDYKRKVRADYLAAQVAA
jgi:hypothetical protein